MSVEALKEQARRHEQKEDWDAALSLYLQAIDRLGNEGEQDVSLYNRVGDLEVRVGRIEKAVEHYEEAVDLYVEGELHNNAIAICKKVVRNLPGRDSIFLKMGQIRAQQGFLTDARHSFLTYAERKQNAGDLEEAFRALIEFVELVPDDIEIRLALAAQLAQHERAEEAVEQYREARRRLILDDRAGEAEAVEEQIREIDPAADLPDQQTIQSEAPAPGAATPSHDPWDTGFTGFAVGEDEGGEVGGPAVGAAASDEAADLAEGSDEGETEFALEDDVLILDGDEAAEEPDQPAAEIAGDDDAGDEAEVEDLPLMDFDLPGDLEVSDTAAGVADVEEPPAVEEAAAAEEAEEDGELDVFDEFEVDSAGEDEGAEPLPTLEDGEDETGATDVSLDGEGLRTEGERLLDEGNDDGRPILEEAHERLADEGKVREAVEVARRVGEERPDDVDLRQRVVEYAYRLGDDDVLVTAFLELAGSLQRTGQEQKAQAVYQQVLESDPENEEAQAALAERSKSQGVHGRPRPEVASSEEYVDLGSMILGDEDEEKSTRFVVAAEAPSGDEAADFAKMLSQFKEKVAENLDTDDVSAHYDLGTAYKEMGLIDEAISEFQSALRASRHHLPTYEMLGQCFLEKEQGDVAVRTLEKALDLSFEVEDELLGIYYYLGRANEGLGRDDTALEYYEKVFALDINFMDVTERLRVLR